MVTLADGHATGLLSGVRILDVTRLLPGPYATMLLRTLGAEVIKIEDTQQGDYLRALSPAVFDMLNAGNRSVALDLKQEAGRMLFRKLLAKADALIEGFRPGVAARLGIDYPQLHETYPRLVYCSVTGYGQSGPYADWPGHDVNYQGIAGSLPPDTPGAPLRQTPILPVADVAAAYNAALAMVAALFAQARSGHGAYLDISLTDAAASFAMPLHIASVISSGTGFNPTLEWQAVAYGAYQCADGLWLTLGVVEEKFWAAVCRVIGQDDWITEYPTSQARYQARELIETELRRTLATRPRAEWLAAFRAADAPAAPLNAPQEAPNDPQLVARGWLATEGRQTYMGFPAVSPAFPAMQRGRGPLLGEHTEALLREAGARDEELAIAQAKGAIVSHEQ